MHRALPAERCRLDGVPCHRQHTHPTPAMGSTCLTALLAAAELEDSVPTTGGQAGRQSSQPCGPACPPSSHSRRGTGAQLVRPRPCARKGVMVCSPQECMAVQSRCPPSALPHHSTRRPTDRLHRGLPVTHSTRRRGRWVQCTAQGTYTHRQCPTPRRRRTRHAHMATQQTLANTHVQPTRHTPHVATRTHGVARNASRFT